MLKHLILWLAICLSMSLLGCGGSEESRAANTSAPATNAGPQLVLANDDVAATLDVPFSFDASQSGQTFSDPNGDRLTYTIRFNSEDSRGLTASGSTISGTPVSFGSVNVTITATDPSGETAGDNFSIRIGTVPMVRQENIDQKARFGRSFFYDASQEGRTFRAKITML